MAQFKDPVCGMTVDPARAAAKVEHRGTTYYFCSEDCRKRFESNPAKYAVEPSSAAPSDKETEMERHEPPRTTTGKFTAPKFGAAGSGGAEYEPLPESHDS